MNIEIKPLIIPATGERGGRAVHISIGRLQVAAGVMPPRFASGFFRYLYWPNSNVRSWRVMIFTVGYKWRKL